MKQSLSAIVLLLMLLIPALSWSQAKQASPPGSQPIPEGAVPTILAAFDKYEVVGMPEAHGQKDLDDFILSLIRNPAFPDKVNDIAVECGNSLYQPILDRYIAGENVPFTEVRQVWRNTSASMCGLSGFFEQFFPLVRAINKKLPTAKRVRVLACDPPIEWEKVKSFDDILKLPLRDVSIATVMEREVLSKHRKALMLFGTFHLFHGQQRNAVSIYEKDYPNTTFVISELGYFDTDLPSIAESYFASWPIPSLVRVKGTSLGALDLTHFLPPGITIHEGDCAVHNEFVKNLQGPVENLVDAFLYLGPQDFQLSEQIPADIALDIDYRKELLRRESLPGFAGVANTLKTEDEQIVKNAENPIFIVPKPRELKVVMQDEGVKKAVQSCLDRASHGSAPR